MRELGHRFGEGPVAESPTGPNGAGRASDAVLRMDLSRSRQAALGADVHPEAVLFASRLARAVAEAPAPEWDRIPARMGAASLVLPGEPALVHDREDRVVRANESFAVLARAVDATALAGVRMDRLFLGADADAQLVRADGELVPVRVVRWPLPGAVLTAVVVARAGRRARRPGGATRPGSRSWSGWPASGPGPTTWPRPPSGAARRSTSSTVASGSIRTAAAARSRASRWPRCARPCVPGQPPATTTSSSSCPATGCSAAGPRSSATRTARRCGWSASSTT